MSSPFLSEIRIVSFNYAPRGWALCNGQLLPINQNQALFALLGTTYGGDGRVNFALPNLQGRTPIGEGAGHTLGEAAGAENVALQLSELPQHLHTLAVDSQSAASANVADPTNHAFGAGLATQNPGGPGPINYFGSAASSTLAPASLGNDGGGQAHSNMQPFLVLSFIIALQGIFPSQN